MFENYKELSSNRSRALRYKDTHNVTINDIAESAGCSKATVSYVLNNRQAGFKVSQETTLKVLNIAMELGYKPDEAGRRLAECKKVPVRLLVLCPWIYTQFSDFMAKLNMVLHEHEQVSKLVVSYMSYSAGTLSEVLSPSLLKKYDAFLVAGTDNKDEQWLTRNAEKLKKIVLMNRRVEGMLSTYCNLQVMSEKLHEKIDFSYYDQAWIVGPEIKRSYDYDRCAAFAQTCADADLKCEYVNLRDYNEIWSVLKEKLVGNKEKILLFIPQYPQAAMVMKNIISENWSIPEQYGIMACDQHMLLDKFITPVLTVIDPCLDLMAAETLKLIYSLRESENQELKLIDFKIRLGETTINKK